MQVTIVMTGQRKSDLGYLSDFQRYCKYVKLHKTLDSLVFGPYLHHLYPSVVIVHTLEYMHFE